jgi:hypothetical protein
LDPQGLLMIVVELRLDGIEVWLDLGFLRVCQRQHASKNSFRFGLPNGGGPGGVIGARGVPPQFVR